MKGGIFLKKTIKKFSAVALAIIIILTLCGFTNGYNPKAYDVNNILNTIKEITSKEFNGRAAGTPDGKKTEDYFAAKFSEIGLKPGGDNGTYFQGFSNVRGDAVGPYLLEVVDGSSVIKTYKYGTDYKFLTRYSCSGEVTAKGIAVEEASGNMPKASGEIALLNVLNITNGETPQPLIDLYNAGYRGVIVPGGETINRVKGQKGFFDDTNASKLPRAAVSKPVFDELMDYSNKGYKIHLKANFVVSPYSANNVIGVLEAAEPTNDCLIISGHMDHVAPDFDGVYFPGALDNASGASCLLEIARALKGQNVKPSINIVFAAFNGEEVWLHGSSKYVSSPLYPLENSKNINLDGVGAKPDVSVGIAVSSYSEGDKKTTELIDEITNIAKDLKYDFIVGNDDSCDHSSFAQSGVPAVTLIDWDADAVYHVPYHVPEDNIDNIGAGNLTKNMDVIMNVIGKEAYEAVPVNRICGQSESETIVEISKAGWPAASENVILASIENFPDAMSGAPFAYLKNAPILLTGHDTLDTAVYNEIMRLQAKNIFILGGPGAVSEAVEGTLASNNYNVQRLFGVDRYKTAIEIGKNLQSDTVVIATGENYPDALAIGPFASRKQYPILFTEKDTLNYDTKKALSDWSIKNAIIVGGAGVVSQNVYDEISRMGITVNRLAGDDRYLTALSIIKHFNDGSFKGIYVATGEDFPDALAGGPLAARNSSPIFMVGRDYVDSDVLQYIKGLNLKGRTYVLGGPGSVPDDTAYKVSR